MLEDNRDILEDMTQALMKYETIDSGQIDQLMDRAPVSAPDGWEESDSKAAEEEAEAQADSDSEEFDLDDSDESSSEQGSSEQDSSDKDPDAPDQNLH